MELMHNPERGPEKEKTREILEGGKYYSYRDNSKPERPVIFECRAGSITEADLMYEKETGIDPRKQNHVGCVISKRKLHSEK